MLHTLTFKKSSLSLSQTPIMAWALVSPSLNLSLPHTAKTNFNRAQWFTIKTTRTTSIRANAADQKQPKDKDEDTTSGVSPFAFVTDNPSSREAIQLPESPAEDGNVGEMLYVCVLTLTHHFLQLGISQTLLSLIIYIVSIIYIHGNFYFLLEGMFVQFMLLGWVLIFILFIS